METVQIPTKLRRNAPCHCGSGKKYKKCCEKKDQKKMEEEKQQSIVTPHSLKNEFRDEIRDPYAGIPEDELVTWDQAVLMKEIRARKFVRELNNTSLDIVISKAKELRAELMGMPKSPYREICIANAGKMIENNQNVLKANRFPLESELTLLALEELFEKTQVIEASTLEVDEGDVPAELSDEDEDALTIDEDDNPAEVI